MIVVHSEASAVAVARKCIASGAIYIVSAVCNERDSAQRRGERGIAERCIVKTLIETRQRSQGERSSTPFSIGSVFPYGEMNSSGILLAKYNEASISREEVHREMRELCISSAHCVIGVKQRYLMVQHPIL